MKKKVKKEKLQEKQVGFTGPIDDIIRRMYEYALKRPVTDEEIRNTPLTDEILDHLGDL